MIYLSSNLKFLRKSKNFTQDDLAKKIHVNRSVIGSYEEGRAEPKLSLIKELADLFNISADDLLYKDFSGTGDTDIEPILRIKGDNLRILTTVVDRNDKEFVTVVPVKAAAGYLAGYADLEYVETLPKFSLPLPELSKERTYRVFQITGDSMLPIQSGSYIICEYVQNWNEIMDGKAYIFLTKEDGIVFKRAYCRAGENNQLMLKSDNSDYEPYLINTDTIIEVWKSLGYISFQLPDPGEPDLHKITRMVFDMKKEIDSLKKERG